jgi:hypothetical protein
MEHFTGRPVDADRIPFLAENTGRRRNSHNKGVLEKPMKLE